jgi:hypothetical protein
LKRRVFHQELMARKMREKSIELGKPVTQQVGIILLCFFVFRSMDRCGCWMRETCHSSLQETARDCFEKRQRFCFSFPNLIGIFVDSVGKHQIDSTYYPERLGYMVTRSFNA